MDLALLHHVQQFVPLGSGQQLVMQTAVRAAMRARRRQQVGPVPLQLVALSVPLASTLLLALLLDVSLAAPAIRQMVLVAALTVLIALFSVL